MLCVHGICLGAQVRQHVVPDACVALMTHGGDVYRRHDDPFAWTGRRVSQQTAVVVDDLAASGP